MRRGRLADTVALPLLLLAACGKPAVPAASPGADSTAAVAAPAPGADVPTPAEQLRFSSILAGFTFEVPASWGRRYTVSERSDPA